MKISVFSLVAAVMLLGAPMLASAQQGHGRGRLRELGLSDAQIQQIRAIRAQGRAQGQRRRETRHQIARILTPEQRQAVHAMRGERRMARMTERLGLSPTQGQQIAAIRTRAHTERDAIAQRTEPRSPERRTAMQALRERTRASVDAILTPEQQALRGQHRRG